MNNFPDFSSHGYQIIRELGHNREAGRITYLATARDRNLQVVIKEFRFAADASSTIFKAYNLHIEKLQQLEHLRLPKYLDSFETTQGFCLVREYKNDVTSLAETRDFTPEEGKQIAISVLEILIYLQKLKPAIIHRNIKPENILLDEQLNAYLVDFGLARMRDGEKAIARLAEGKPGFLPPEELFNRPLTEASDIYSLGATLICMLTKTRSHDIGNLIDDNYRFNLKGQVPKISTRFVEWLKKMVSPNVKQRFNNAETALKALKPIQVVSYFKFKPVAILGLVLLISIGFIGTNFITSRQKNLLETQLLKTRYCPGCKLQQISLTNGNLAGANLESANLESADLRYAILKGAKLELANLKGANLRSAKLDSANLENANLENADLSGANLINANLVNVSMRSANLKNAYIKDANFKGANLEGAGLEGVAGKVNLEGANLESANLVDAQIVGTNLQGANLKSTNLVGANLRDANLKGANLETANLVGANLTGANLEGANLEGANLVSANLEGAKLTGANLKGAIAPDGTKYE